MERSRHAPGGEEYMLFCLIEAHTKTKMFHYLRCMQREELFPCWRSNAGHEAWNVVHRQQCPKERVAQNGLSSLCLC